MMSVLRRAGRENRALLRTVYFICYVAGVYAIRCVMRLFPLLLEWAQRFEARLRRSLRRTRRRIRRRLHEWAHHSFINLRNFSLVCREIRQRFRASAMLPLDRRLRLILPYFGVILRLFWRSFCSLFNHVAPVAAILFFFFVVDYYTDMQFGLQVAYNGQNLGLVENESIFEQAQSNIRDRIITTEDDSLLNREMVPTYSVLPVEELNYISVDDLTDRLIRASGSELMQAAGLYIDGRFAGATVDAQGVLTLLDSLLSEHRTEDGDETVGFIDPIRLSSGLYPVDSVLPLAQIEEVLASDVEGEKWYTVQPGDAPTLIADMHDIPYSQLKALNPNIEKSLLIGSQVLVSQSKPFLGIQVDRTITYTEDIPFAIERTYNNKVSLGTTKTLQKGKNGSKQVTARVTYIDGAETERTILRSVVTEEAVNQKIEIGTQTPLQALPSSFSGSSAKVKFLWPTAAGYISCAYGGYVGHTGMDIAAPYGTGIYASAAGTVVVSRYYGAYGRYIIIDHGGGVQTLYAHNSANYVQVGAKVKQGQLIGAIGSTGNSTGNHCHFEIRINGSYKNPAYYLNQ